MVWILLAFLLVIFIGTGSWIVLGILVALLLAKVALG